MSPDSVKNVPVILICDFCKTQGLLNQTIFNHAGWYYCQNCLIEIPKMTNRLKQTITQPSLF
jgi:hypothetical protein